MKAYSILQSSSPFLLPLNSLKQSLKIAFPERLGAFPLDDFVKNGRAILYRFRENLEQITFFIPINQNIEPFKFVDVFFKIANPFHAPTRSTTVS